MRQWLCKIGRHQGRVHRVRGHRYHMDVTMRCVWCGHEWRKVRL